MSRRAVAAEVYVMGVKLACCRHGIGRILIESAARLAASQGVQFLTVKTLSPARVDPNYAATRAFYQAVGFLPIEEFPDLWGAENPCLLMLRPLGIVGRPSCREMDCFAGPRDDGERLM
jgi:ribosomal protein S18 acetylase RimI-like enzyme